MSKQNEKDASYDPHITSAETAARQEREGNQIQETADDDSGIDTTAGATVDKEGLANNYAVEPEMYVEEPGDLREKEEAEQAERAEELQEVKQQGEKGPGAI